MPRSKSRETSKVLKEEVNALVCAYELFLMLLSLQVVRQIDDQTDIVYNSTGVEGGGMVSSRYVATHALIYFTANLTIFLLYIKFGDDRS